MGGEKGMLLLVMVMVMIVCGCKCEDIKVGGCSGWTNVGPLHYKSWSASNNFHVADTLLFQYNKEFQNVVRVTHKHFRSCNSTAPYATWATGNDSFTIPRPGHFYFICSLPGHCQSGQKVDIRVPRHVPVPVPAPSPLPPNSPSSPPVSVAPVPSPRSGCSSLHLSSKFWVLLVLAIGYGQI